MKNQAIDCIKMKEQAQRECARAYEGLSLPERRRKMAEMIMSDPHLARIYQRLFLQAPGVVCEPGAVYSTKTPKSGRKTK